MGTVETKSTSQNEMSQPEKIVSGGQTGVDRAALDAALESGIPIGGWCPRGRRAERGIIPERYPLKETAARSYAVRTEWNVRDSDGTLILVMTGVSGGTKLTLDHARRLSKPVLVVHLRPADSQTLFCDDHSRDEQIAIVRDWLNKFEIRILNVAGPRGSSHPDVYDEAKSFLCQMFQAAPGVRSSC